MAAPLRAPIFDLVDSRGHSRFVLRILIILSHHSRKLESLCLLLERGRRGGPLRPSRALVTKQRVTRTTGSDMTGRNLLYVPPVPVTRQREVLPPLAPARSSPRLGPPLEAGQAKALLLPDCFRTPFFYLVDSGGHSRFVLRILICLSQHLRPRQGVPSHP